MKAEVLEIVSPGLRASLQNHGKPGWRRFGVPPGGAMDDHAALYANRLLDNPPEATTLELLLQGAKLKMLREAWIAVTGARSQANVPLWRAVHAAAGQVLRFPRQESGVWIYVAVEGGFAVTPPDANAGSDPWILPGEPLRAGDRLHGQHINAFQMPSRVSGRVVAWEEQRDYDHPPVLRVWPGPQRETFSAAEQRAFWDTAWKVTPQSNRIGYRLQGRPLKTKRTQIISEPVRVGSIQIPDNGQPIVTMRDGPTVGGYPKIGMVDPRDLSWLTQIRPGQSVRFQEVGP